MLTMDGHQNHVVDHYHIHAANNLFIRETERRGQASGQFTCLTCPHSLDVLEVADKSGKTRDDMRRRVGILISHLSPEAGRSLSVVPIFCRRRRCGWYWDAAGACQPIGRQSSSMDHCFRDHGAQRVPLVAIQHQHRPQSMRAP